MADKPKTVTYQHASREDDNKPVTQGAYEGTPLAAVLKASDDWERVSSRSTGKSE